MSLREAVVYYYCIPEASKRVPIFPFDTQGGKQVSSYFRQRNWVQAERLRSGSLQ